MTDKFESKGYWYLPSNPDNAIAGILTFIPNQSIELELIGAFGESSNKIATFFNRSRIDIIWGITSDAKEISLINCIPSGGNYNLSCTFPISKYSIQYCLKGILIDDFNDKRFTRANVTIPELATWCPPNALELKYEPNEKGSISKVNVSFNTDANEITNTIVSVEINDSTILKIKKGVDYYESQFYLNPIIKQSTFLQIQKRSNSSVTDFLSDILLFEKFITLSFLSTIQISNIFLIDEDIFQSKNDGEKIYHPIELFYVQRKLELKETKEHELLFSYSQIEDIFPNIIKKWYHDTIEIIPIRTHLIQSIQKKKTFDSTDFLIIIQALEGFCNRFRKEQSLTKMLVEIISEFDDINKVRNSNINIKATVDSRHYYSHFMKKSKKPNTLDGLELFHLTNKLRTLLICCVLNFIGIDNIRINELLNKSYNNRV